MSVGQIPKKRTFLQLRNVKGTIYNRNRPDSETVDFEKSRQMVLGCFRFEPGSLA